MPYTRYYRDWNDELGTQYRLLIIPTNANIGESQSNLASLTTFSLVQLPADAIMESMKLSTELGEIPSGLVSQTLELNINLASLQGTNALNDLRECLLRGTMQKGYPYKSDNTALGFQFDRFNTFVLYANYGSGLTPIFIGCQKFSAENELTAGKLDNVVNYKIECFDALRAIAEQIPPLWYGYYYFSTYEKTTSIDYGNSYSEALNVPKRNMFAGWYEFTNTDNVLHDEPAIDYAIQGYAFHTNTFNYLKSLMDEMLTQFMKSIFWNTTSTMTVPIPFARAWTFYKKRNSYKGARGSAITRPAFVSEITKISDAGVNCGVFVKGGAIIDNTALGKNENFYETFKALVENTLEIYRVVYAYSSVSDLHSMTMQSDYIRPQTGSGITFTNLNIYSDVKFKMFQETVRSAKTSVSTLTSEKDTKTFPFQKGTSSDNGIDIELMFHNLPSASNRNSLTDYYDEETKSIVVAWSRSAINCGVIVENDNGNISRIDTDCDFKYSATDVVNLPVEYVDEKASGVATLMIKEQQTGGIPQTISEAIVTALGDEGQVECSFKTVGTLAQYQNVGMNCTVNINSINPLLTKIYNANTGTGVIQKHELDCKTGMADIVVRMWK